ncbi:MAG: SDR family oxidoreductase [Kofleriaceae bacterium]
MKYEGKVVLITGGSTGIGRAIAARFADEGAQVTITARNEADLREAARGRERIRYLVADVSRSSEVARVVEELGGRYGRLDVLCNNAGIARMVPIERSSVELLDETFAVNVRGAFELTQRALPLLEAAKGSVINLGTSITNAAVPMLAAYAASKAALASLTRSWAKALAPRGIRVNLVHPGPTETPIFGKFGLPPEQLQAMAGAFVQEVPLGRFGQPADVAAVVAFLASAEASFVTGAEYAVGGGHGL